MTDKVISIESIGGPHQDVLTRIMRMVPDRDKHDIDLRRLIAFRLHVDGEGDTSEYLMRKIRDMIQCAYHGRLYDFLKDDELERACSDTEPNGEPPEIA